MEPINEIENFIYAIYLENYKNKILLKSAH